MENDAVIGNIVLRVHEDLNRLQEKLKTKETQNNINVADIKDLISTTQTGLQKRAEEILNHLNSRVTSSSTIDNSGQKRRISASLSINQEKLKQLQEINLNDEMRQTEMLAWNYASPGENVKKEMALKSLSNPHNKMNRYFANEMYGIQLPLIHEKSTMKTQNSDAIQKGSMVKKLEKLPLETNKFYNNTKPSKITEFDARKGLLNLIERGLIPPNAKITFDPPPINNGTVPILSASMKNRVIVPAGANDQGYSVACYHLDETGGTGNDFLDDDVPEQKGVELEKVNLNSNEKAIPGMSNIMKNVIKAHNTKLKEIEADNNKLKKSILLRNNRDRPTNFKSIKTIQFNNDVEEKEIPTFRNDNVTKEMTVPPPTTPASQLSKSNIDTYHKFVMKDGILRHVTDDFIKFKRHYCLVWGGIVSIIEALEKFLKKYSIPLAFVNGDRVADLSVEYELEMKPSEEELLSCLINARDVIDLLKRPGRRFMGQNRKDCAALVIQSKWRAYVARKFYLEYRRKRWAAGVIAIQWILHMKMTHVKEELQKIRVKHLANFKLRYKELGTKWAKLNSSRRVVIHLPSFGLTEIHRSKLKKLPELQNHQMTRLCDLMDNNVDVIYISPVPMNEEIIQYFSKLLALKSAVDSGNSSDQKQLNSRYKIIVPEAIKSFPNHNMCLSSILKYSPRALSRIKNMIQGRNAWIVPGMMHTDDVYIGELLNVPIIGTEPEILDIHKSKSGIRKLFEQAKVDISPGERGIKSLTQLHESFAQLIIDNLNIKQWIFKTNFDIKSQGIGFIDIDVHLSCYNWAQKEQKRYGEKWKKKWAQENAYNRILREVPDIIETNLTLVDPKFYSTKSKFWKEFFSKDGIIEAYPGSESVTNITVNMFIDPTGKIHMTGSGDQIHDGNRLNAWGYSVPQSSIDSEILNDFSYKIAETCRQNDIKGYFSIDFVTFVENNEENQLIWAVDLDFQYSDLASLMNLSIFATKAQFKSDDHSLIADMPSIHPDPILSVNRFVCLSSQISHSNLSLVHYSVFFQMCRAHGIGFDLKEKQGTIFSLIDSFNRENISMITIGTSLEQALESFAKNLYILHQEISSPNMAGHGNFQLVIKEIESILGLAIENTIINESRIKET